MAIDSKVEIRGAVSRRGEEILSDQALEFVAALQRRFNPRREELLRARVERQQRLGCPAVADAQLNLNCRDEAVPILAALRHVYGRPALRDQILEAVA